MTTPIINLFKRHFYSLGLSEIDSEAIIFQCDSIAKNNNQNSVQTYNLLSIGYEILADEKTVFKILNQYYDSKSFNNKPFANFFRQLI